MRHGRKLPHLPGRSMHPGSGRGAARGMAPPEIRPQACNCCRARRITPSPVLNRGSLVGPKGGVSNEQRRSDFRSRGSFQKPLADKAGVILRQSHRVVTARRWPPSSRISPGTAGGGMTGSNRGWPTWEARAAHSGNAATTAGDLAAVGAILATAILATHDEDPLTWKRYLSIRSSVTLPVADYCGTQWSLDGRPLFAR